MSSSSAWSSTDLTEVAGDDGGRVHYPATRQLGDLATVGVDPDGRLAGHRVDAVAAVGTGDQPRRRDRQQTTGVGQSLDRPPRLGS